MARKFRVIDSHVHMMPWSTMKREVLQVLKFGRDFGPIMKLADSPDKFIQLLDNSGVEKAVIVNYVSPDIMGLTGLANEFCAEYCGPYPDRLIPFGSVHPRFSKNARSEMKRLIMDLGIKGIKIHPVHQLIYPNEYRNGKLRGLEAVYSMAQEYGVPVMIHTGTSIFPGARNKYGDPIYADDVAVDFPDLTIIIAHGGRPLWTDTAFFLARWHKNVYMDISSTPPNRLLHYFPRLEEIADKTLFGSDWAGPLVPSIKKNVEEFTRLPIPDEAKRKILYETAAKLLK